MSNKTSIIICTLNEVKFVESCIDDIFNKIPNVELIIVDDNSTDGTIEKIRNHNKAERFKFIIREKDTGLASAFLRGVFETAGEYIGWIDTNMGYLIPKFLEMQNFLKGENDIVVLSRYIEGGSDERTYLRSLSSKYINLFCKFFFNSKINDFTSGIFLIKKKIINEVPFVGYGHGDFIIEFLYHAEKKGFKILEIPYIQKKDLYPLSSKSAPTHLRFLLLGAQYMMRIIFIKFKKI